MELERALGVTRIARVTGLCRAGVEVACAVRPGGHVLQVANGKGLTWAQARASAISEAAELWAAERAPQDQLLFGARKELRNAWSADDLGSAGALVAPRLWFRQQSAPALRRIQNLALIQPGLDPDHAIRCPRFGKSIIDVRSQRVQRKLAL